MARQKRPHPLLLVARRYLSERLPELKDEPLRLRTLDGPPEAPRYSVTVEVCAGGACPYEVPADLALSGQCPVSVCRLRRSVRLLLDRRGTVIQETQSTIHWS